MEHYVAIEKIDELCSIETEQWPKSRGHARKASQTTYRACSHCVEREGIGGCVYIGIRAHSLSLSIRQNELVLTRSREMGCRTVLKGLFIVC